MYFAVKKGKLAINRLSVRLLCGKNNPEYVCNKRFASYSYVYRRLLLSSILRAIGRVFFLIVLLNIYSLYIYSYNAFAQYQHQQRRYIFHEIEEMWSKSIRNCRLHSFSPNYKVEFFVLCCVFMKFVMMFAQFTIL